MLCKGQKRLNYPTRGSEDSNTLEHNGLAAEGIKTVPFVGEKGGD